MRQIHAICDEDHLSVNCKNILDSAARLVDKETAGFLLLEKTSCHRMQIERPLPELLK